MLQKSIVISYCIILIICNYFYDFLTYYWFSIPKIGLYSYDDEKDFSFISVRHFILLQLHSLFGRFGRYQEKWCFKDLRVSKLYAAYYG